MKRLSYRNYMLVLLMVIYAFSSVDRLALGLVLQSIKSDLDLSDTRLGFLSGIAFSLFYAVMGIPIARWADRGNRPLIIALTTALWSISVALMAVVRSFPQLLLLRISVAVGEAGCVPSALSMIADNFDRESRPRAVSAYLQGGSISLVIGYFVAGWVNEYLGWRNMFLLLSAPACILVILALLTLREPRRAALRGPTVEKAPADGGGEDATEQPASFGEVARSLWSNRSFRSILLFYSVGYFFNAGITQWHPAFFIRKYGISTGELGTWMAATAGIGMVLGIYAGGELASRYAATNEKLQLRAMALSWCALSVISAAIIVAPNRYCAFACLGLLNIVGTMALGPLMAIVQSLVPRRSRATSIAIIYLFSNLVGMGLGPFTTGFLSDLIAPLVGADSLRDAMLCLSPGYVCAGLLLWLAAGSVARDLPDRIVATDGVPGELSPRIGAPALTRS